MFNQQEEDEKWMGEALAQARLAHGLGEVPIGAVVVLGNLCIGQGFNQSIAKHDSTAHAEVVAIRNAGRCLRNYRLTETTLYVTLEPCCMCLGAMLHARIKRCVYAASDPKTGVAHTCDQLQDRHWALHRMRIEGGVMADESSKLLRQFFKSRRRVAALSATLSKSSSV